MHLSSGYACPTCISMYIGHAFVSSYVLNGHAFLYEDAALTCILVVSVHVRHAFYMSTTDFDECVCACADCDESVRVILLFKAALSPNLHTAPTQHTLAFIEEFWPYRPIDTDILDDEYGCSMMYSTTPHACYYVIGVGRILGTAAITPNSAPDRIPYRGLRTPQSRRQNPGATADTGPYNSSGSPLYRLNIWHMMWGSMISARPIPFPTPSSLTDSQKDAVAQRHATDPGCSFRRAGTSWVPLAGHDSF